jgi:fermentation-respiration switch protein FrsA (DUF1100 family)
LRLLILAVVVVVAVGAIPALRAVRAYREESKAFASRRWAVHAPADSAALGISDVNFRSRDGHNISGWYIPSRHGAAVILCHGSQADRSSMLDDARELVRGGLGVLMFDWPGQGQSEGRVELGASERSALVGALDFLGGRKDVTSGRIGALGVSAGSYTVIAVAAADPRILAVVVAGAFGDADAQLRAEYSNAGRAAIWAARLADRMSGFDFRAPRPIDVIGQIAPRPIVIVAGSADQTTPPALGQALFEAAREPKQFWLIEGARHTGYAAADPSYRGRMRAFFDSALVTSRVVGTQAGEGGEPPSLKHSRQDGS